MSLCVAVLAGIVLAQSPAFAQGEGDAEEIAGESTEVSAEEASGTTTEDVTAESEDGSDTDTAAEGPQDTSTKSVKIADIVNKIKELQKKIKQSQQRMDEVVNIVLNTTETKGAKAIIAVENGMSGSFVPIQAVVTLDGAPIFKKSDEDGILESGEMEVFNGAILPGEHTLSVLLVYRGAGYGIFSYLQGYRFKVRSSTKFKVKEGKGIKLKIIGYEKGDQDTKMEDRPAIKYVQQKISID